MNYGLYLSASGTLTSLHRQDVLANNLANINTVGFKPDFVALQARLPERLESGDAMMNPEELLEQLGGGHLSNDTRISLRQGELTSTGNDLDLAIQGDGFFVVDTGTRGGDALRFLRDGRFTINTAGELVTASAGMRVLDVNDQPIRLNRNAPVEVHGDGAIQQNGATVAQVQISTVRDDSQLQKEGHSLVRFTGSNRIAATGSVKQRAIESSAVDPIMMLNSMINASKAVQANATMMQYHDNILGQAVNTLGRVA